MKPATEKIDILQMELELKLPHWLDPTQRNPEPFDNIRKRNRAAWLATLEISGKPAARTKARRDLATKKDDQRPEAPLRPRDYDESEHPRDEHGRWTDAGGGDEPSAAPSPSAGSEASLQSYTRPGNDDVRRWDAQIGEQINALDQAGDAASKQGMELQRMSGALGMWLRTSEADRNSGKVGIFVVTDVNSEKPLAAMLILFSEKDRTALVNFNGAIDAAAKVSALQQLVRTYSEVHSAEMIEANEWADDADAIKQYEQAGFRRAGEPSLKGLGLQRMVWGEDKPPPAPPEPPKRMTDDAIMQRVNQVAKDADFDPSRIRIEHGEHHFTLNGKDYVAAGTAYTTTTKDVVIWADHVQPPFIDGVIRHEIEHIQFQHALDAYRAEYDKVMNDPEDLGMRADGSLPPAAAAKYPIYSAMHAAFFSPSTDSFAAADGVSDYSFQYWKSWKGGNVGPHLAFHETLAEMARIKYETGKFPDHMGEHIISYRGENVPKPSKAQMAANAKLWRDLFRTVQKIWKERPPSP